MTTKLLLLALAVLVASFGTVYADTLERSSSQFSIEDVKHPEKFKSLSLAEVKRQGYRYVPSRPLDKYTKTDEADCQCNCHVTSVESATPFECYCICPAPHEGKKGDKGFKGATGAMGQRGERGVQGPKGDIGLQGPAGRQGPRGPKGERGEEGEAGGNGKDGLDFFGPIGPEGPPGDIEPGMPGVVGPTGPRGDRGEKGSVGETDEGTRGPVGKEGLKGPKGDTGDTGDTGDIGRRGKVGPLGPDGPMSGVLDGASLYLQSMASAGCAGLVTTKGKRSVIAAQRPQTDTYVCANTCATICSKASENSRCLGGFFVPEAPDQIQRPAAGYGELGFTAYKFPLEVCETAGCDQANWCCCEENSAEYTDGPQSIAGLKLWLAADKIDQMDLKEVGPDRKLFSWQDFSGSGLHAVAVLKNTAPVIEIAALETKPVVRFGYAPDVSGYKEQPSWLSLGKKFDLTAEGSTGVTLIVLAKPMKGKGPIFDFGVVPRHFGFTLGIDEAASSYIVGISTPTNRGGAAKEEAIKYEGTSGYVIVTYQIVYGKTMRVMVNPVSSEWNFEVPLQPGMTSLSRAGLAVSDSLPSTIAGVPSIGHRSSFANDKDPDVAFHGAIVEMFMYESALTLKDIHLVECFLENKYSVGACRPT